MLLVSPVCTHCVICVFQIDKLSFPFAPSCAQAFRDRLPPVAARNKSAVKLRLQPGYSPNYWSYGTSYLVTLLFNGQLPSSFLKEVCHGHINKEKPAKTNQPCSPLYKRQKELWEPKDHKKLQITARRIEQKVMQARLRQRERYDAISSKIHTTIDRDEDILLAKGGTMERGKRAYLDKLATKTKVPQRKVTVKKVEMDACKTTEEGFEIVDFEDCVSPDGSPIQDESKSSE